MSTTTATAATATAANNDATKVVVEVDLTIDQVHKKILSLNKKRELIYSCYAQGVLSHAEFQSKLDIQEDIMKKAINDVRTVYHKNTCNHLYSPLQVSAIRVVNKPGDYEFNCDKEKEFKTYCTIAKHLPISSLSSDEDDIIQVTFCDVCKQIMSVGVDVGLDWDDFDNKPSDDDKVTNTESSEN